MAGEYISVYKSEKHKTELCALYDMALKKWPVPYTELFLETRCGRTHVIRCGNENGKPVVLFHGTGNNSLSWKYSASDLGSSFDLYLIDTINDPGKSDASVGFDPSCDYAAWVNEILGELKLDKPFCAGHSKGAWIALNSLVSDPDCFEKVVLLAPAVGIHERMSRSFMLRSIYVGMAPSVKNLRSYFDYVFGPDKKASQSYIEYFRQILLGTRSKPIRHRQFTDDELRNVRAPVMIVFGDHEVCVDYEKAAARARRLIANVEIEIVKNAGHGLHGEKPEIVNGLMRNFFERRMNTV